MIFITHVKATQRSKEDHDPSYDHHHHTRDSFATPKDFHKRYHGHDYLLVTTMTLSAKRDSCTEFDYFDFLLTVEAINL